MDIGTAKDMIEDMHHEIIGLRKEIAHYEKITDMAYTLAGGHITGCLQWQARYNELVGTN
jgi:hypothetical protein